MTFVLSGFISCTCITFGCEMSFVIPHLYALVVRCQSLDVTTEIMESFEIGEIEHAFF